MTLTDMLAAQEVPGEDRSSSSALVARGTAEIVAVNPLRARPHVRHWMHRELLSPGDLIAPLLVQPDGLALSGYPKLPTAVALRRVGHAAEQLWAIGVGAVKLFCHVVDKRPDGSAAIDPDNLMVAAIREVRRDVPDMVIATEVCGCAWTSSGECVLLDKDAFADLEATYRLMSEMAVLHADQGADIVGPAAVLDGSVAEIRAALDAAGHRNVGITPSIIFDSALFDPYKSAMHTDPGRGHRRGLQIDGCHIGQALDCADRWLDEGADSLLVQPAMMAVDLLARLRERTNVPITAFSVSGEHQLLAKSEAVYFEFTRMLRRAGANYVMTYGAGMLSARLVVHPTGP